MILSGIWWLSFVCCLTLLGNLLVILAVFRESTLHSATYYYIVSLAVADLCVGVIVIPLAIIFELSIPKYFDFLCHLWHITDVGASTASILALCVIALDRYIAITSPIRYPRSFLARHSSIVIAMIWFCSGIIAGPIVMVLGQRFHSNEKRSKQCEFPSDPTFIIISSSVSFYIPLIIMVFVYGRILISARRQMIALRQGYKRTTGGVNNIGISGDNHQLTPLIHRCFSRSNKKVQTRTIENLHITQMNSPETITLRIHRGKYSRSPSLSPINQRSSLHTNQQSSFSTIFLHRLRKLGQTQAWTKFSREHKATKVLGIVMGVFIACWLPFFVFLPLTRVFHINFHDSEEQLFRLFTWLGYTNSALNFLVYVLTSREFRLAFIKLLCPRAYIQRSLRHSTYKQQQQNQPNRI